MPKIDEMGASIISSILSSLEKIHSPRALEQLFIKDVEIFQAVGGRLREYPDVDSRRQEDIDLFIRRHGGMEVYETVIIEMKEIIFMYETQAERDAKGRPSKTDRKKNYIYLLEAYDILHKVFKDCYLEMCKKEAELLPGQVSLKVFQIYLDTDELQPPALPNPEQLMEKYKPQIQALLANVQESFEMIDGDSKDYDYKKALGAFSLWGVGGLRAQWAKQPALRARISLDYIVEEAHEERFFNAAYLKNIAPKLADELAEFDTEVNIYLYLKNLNRQLISVLQTPALGGMSEMQIALYYYLQFY